MLASGFLLNLWDILNKPKKHSGAYWSSCGSKFVVSEPQLFLSCLNVRGYIYRSIKDVGLELINTGFLQQSVEPIEYSHPLFLKDDPSKISCIGLKEGTDSKCVGGSDNSLLLGMMKMLLSTMTSFSEQVTQLQAEITEYKNLFELASRASEIRHDSLVERNKALKKEIKELKSATGQKSEGSCPCYERRVSTSLHMEGLNKRIKEKFVGINSMQLSHAKLTNTQVIDELLRKKMIPLLFLLNNKFQQGIEYFLHPCRGAINGNQVQIFKTKQIVSKAAQPKSSYDSKSPIADQKPTDHDSAKFSPSKSQSSSDIALMSTLKSIESSLGSENNQIHTSNVPYSGVVLNQEKCMQQGSETTMCSEYLMKPRTLRDNAAPQKEKNQHRDNFSSVKRADDSIESQRLANPLIKRSMPSTSIDRQLGHIYSGANHALVSNGRFFPAYKPKDPLNSLNILKRPAMNENAELASKRAKIAKFDIRKSDQPQSIPNLVKAALNKLSGLQSVKPSVSYPVVKLPPMKPEKARTTAITQLDIKREPTELTEVANSPQIVEKPPHLLEKTVTGRSIPTSLTMESLVCHERFKTSTPNTKYVHSVPKPPTIPTSAIAIAASHYSATINPSGSRSCVNIKEEPRFDSPEKINPRFDSQERKNPQFDRPGKGNSRLPDRHLIVENNDVSANIVAQQMRQINNDISPFLMQF